MAFEVTIEGGEKLMDALAQSPQIAREEINGGFDKMAIFVERTMKQEAPIDTGKLRQSIHSTQSIMDSSFIVQTGVDYARYVEEGSKAVPKSTLIAINAARISPRARARLPRPSSNGYIYFRGRKAIPPNPFAERTVEKSQSYIEKVVADIALRIAKRSVGL